MDEKQHDEVTKKPNLVQTLVQCHTNNVGLQATLSLYYSALMS